MWHREAARRVWAPHDQHNHRGSNCEGDGAGSDLAGAPASRVAWLAGRGTLVRGAGSGQTHPTAQPRHQIAVYRRQTTPANHHAALTARWELQRHTGCTHGAGWRCFGDMRRENLGLCELDPGALAVHTALRPPSQSTIGTLSVALALEALERPMAAADAQAALDGELVVRLRRGVVKSTFAHCAK